MQVFGAFGQLGEDFHFHRAQQCFGCPEGKAGLQNVIGCGLIRRHGCSSFLSLLVANFSTHACRRRSPCGRPAGLFPWGKESGECHACVTRAACAVSVYCWNSVTLLLRSRQKCANCELRGVLVALKAPLYRPVTTTVSPAS